jgi:hypothetical protein
VKKIVRATVNRRRTLAPVWACGVLCAACAVAFISTYDEPTERAVTSLQAAVDSFLITLAREPRPPACTYEQHKAFYPRTLAGISSLEVRNRARPQNEITVEQITLLDSSFVLLERIHQGKGDSACMSAAEIEPLRRDFNTTFTAILTLELAKKRGK